MEVNNMNVDNMLEIMNDKAIDLKQSHQELEIKLQRLTLDIIYNIRLAIKAMKSLGLSDEEIKTMNPELMQLPEKTINFLFSE
jgi:hypothetical protein